MAIGHDDWLTGEKTPVPETWLQPGHWHTAARGLRLYRALILVGIGLALVLKVLAATAMDWDGRVEVVLYLGLAVGLAVAVPALVGLSRWARLPAESGGRGYALSAFAMSFFHFVLTAVEVAIVSEVVTLMYTPPPGLGGAELLAAIETRLTTMLVLLFAQALLGIGAQITFFLSMRAVSTRLMRGELARAIGRTLLIAMGLAAYTLLQIIIVEVTAPTLWLKALLDVVLFAAAIWVIIRTVGHMGALAAAIEEDVRVSTTF